MVVIFIPGNPHSQEGGKRRSKCASFELFFVEDDGKETMFAGEWCLIYLHFFSSLPGIFPVELKAPDLMPTTFQVSGSLDMSEGPCNKSSDWDANAAPKRAMSLLPTASF